MLSPVQETPWRKYNLTYREIFMFQQSSAQPKKKVEMDTKSYSMGGLRHYKRLIFREKVDLM